MCISIGGKKTKYDSWQDKGEDIKNTCPIRCLVWLQQEFSPLWCAWEKISYFTVQTWEYGFLKQNFRFWWTANSCTKLCSSPISSKTAICHRCYLVPCWTLLVFHMKVPCSTISCLNTMPIWSCTCIESSWNIGEIRFMRTAFKWSWDFRGLSLGAHYRNKRKTKSLL